jgi:RHS repeat-associated protein
MISSRKQPSAKLMKMLLRWLVLGLLFAGTHAFAQSAGTVTYVYTDPQGTPLAETDASGNITATFDYTPYGTYAPNGTSTPGPNPNGPGYTGHVNDPETNLVYMQARYYDPATGHFLSTDPVKPAAGDTFNFNRYAYVDNNPIMGMDPTGMDDDCGPGCTIMRRLQNWYDGIGKGELSGGSGMPTKLLGQAQATTTYVDGEIHEDLSTAAGAAAPVADAVPGATLVACAAGESCGAGTLLMGSLSALPGDAIEVGAARWLESGQTVIGKLADLKVLSSGETTLLDRLPNLGNPKANWLQNAGVLRQVMSAGQPIRDASVDASGGLINNTGFLRAERNLLDSHGWSYDPSSTMWSPPSGH